MQTSFYQKRSDLRYRPPQLASQHHRSEINYPNQKIGNKTTFGTCFPLLILFDIFERNETLFLFVLLAETRDLLLPWHKKLSHKARSSFLRRASTSVSSVNPVRHFWTERNSFSLCSLSWNPYLCSPLKSPVRGWTNILLLPKRPHKYLTCVRSPAG